VGVWDDVNEVFWKTQFFYQVAIAILVYIFGLRIYAITNPLGGMIVFDSSFGIIFSVFLVIAWIVMIVNSINWLDGIDGLSGGVSFICVMTMVFLSLTPHVNQPPVAIIALIIAGTILGFLVFNFNPSIVIAGTSGSMFMGFSLAILAIFAGAKIATAILVLAIPIIDFIWVIGERIKNKKSIFKADENHLHHKLMQLGWSQKKIAVHYYAITMMIAMIALNTRAVGKSITLLTAFIVMATAILFINKKIIKKSIAAK
jgi:UDP-GlcNAc:undecaprenyl-phosphate GlcNAc-1-phosphate transferase